MIKFKNKLMGNIFSLLVLQGSNYVLPLLTFPFLVRTLGIEQYGKLIFVTSFIIFFNIICDYGLNVTATKQIALAKEDKSKTQVIYSNVLTLKLFLTLISLIILLIVIMLIPKFRADAIFYLVGFLVVIGNSLFPIWLFQGLEEMKYITFINIFSKLISTALLFLFIRSDSDTLLAVFMQSLNFLLPGIIAPFFIQRKLGLTFSLKFSLPTIKKELKDGLSVFLTNVWINFYTSGTIIILGLIGGNKAAGYYSVGQKITSAVVGLTQPIAQATYPHMVNLYNKNFKQFIKFRKNLIIVSFCSSAFLSLLFYLFSNQLVYIVTGAENIYTVSIMKYFAIALFFIVTNIQTTNIAFVIGEYKRIQSIYLFIAIIFWVSAIPLTLWLGAKGMILSVILVEACVFICILKISKIKKKKRTNRLLT